MTYTYLTIRLRDKLIYAKYIPFTMYLICPSGLMEVLYSAFAKSEYISHYWSEKEGMHIFRYVWEDATFIYSEKKVKFQKTAILNLMTKTKTYRFQITKMEKIVNQETGLLEMLNLDVFEVNEKKDGSFFLSMYDKEQKVYDMNHLKRVWNED